MGCCDGTLLKRIYSIIKEKTVRGQYLDQYPLELVGIDFNQAALAETGITLKELPHRLYHGDIGDPLGLMETLKKDI